MLKWISIFLCLSSLGGLAQKLYDGSNPKQYISKGTTLKTNVDFVAYNLQEHVRVYNQLKYYDSAIVICDSVFSNIDTLYQELEERGQIIDSMYSYTQKMKHNDSIRTSVFKQEIGLLKEDNIKLSEQNTKVKKITKIFAYIVSGETLLLTLLILL